MAIDWQYSRISKPEANFIDGTYSISSSRGKYEYDSTSQAMPGYRFQYQVPPTSPPFSQKRTSSNPAACSLCHSSSPAKPAPTTAMSHSSVSASRAIGGSE